MTGPSPDVYTAAEIAQAAGVPEGYVDALLARGEIRPISAFLPADVPLDPRLDRFIPHPEAVRVVRALRGRRPVGTPDRMAPLLAAGPAGSRRGLSLLVSTTVHGLAAAAVLAIAGLGLTRGEPTTALAAPVDVPRMVFLVEPGPGGGGGGGGSQAPVPPPRAARQGVRRVSSPLPARRPEAPAPRPLTAHDIAPPVTAPVAASPADDHDRAGVIEATALGDARGPGAGEGAGTGQGAGLGAGTGSGIGAGDGGGTGGGPYRAGSGVEPPRLVKEVRADYTDEARRANIAGEVLLEIVVLRDGGVGDVRVVRGLDAGLDRRAVQAVRQWRFAPARLRGAPVDVIVEVSVEFALR